MKSTFSAENTQRPMLGSTKRQIVSRLRRAILHAQNLSNALQESACTRATNTDILEARAYLCMLQGTLNFEKAQWTACLQHYSVTRIIFATLGPSVKTDSFKDLLSSQVDPSIRYAAYQTKLPRTKPVPEIAIEHFPATEEDTKKRIQEVDPQAFEIDRAVTGVAKGSLKDLPSTLTWRKRRVKIEDAAISQALGVAESKEATLASTFDSFRRGEIDSKDLAAAYEEVINARQDAVDATKTAIDELAAEGVEPGDQRIQSLQVTRTAVNYAVIEWRIGRNRILCGPHDGMEPPPEKRAAPKTKKDGEMERASRPESSGRKISRLREQVALYDSILQSLDTVLELPGVAADTELVEEVNTKKSYFRALKCLAVGRSHAIGDHTVNALALYARAHDLCQTTTKAVSNVPAFSGTSASQPTKLELSQSQIENLTAVVARLVTQYRALAELKALSQAKPAASSADKRPLAERLHEFDEPVDFTNLVTYPPKLQPIPVKPLFFDLAWNYIEYPGRTSAGMNGVLSAAQTEEVKEVDRAPVVPAPPAPEPKAEEKKAPAGKRGWFGFGRG